jgi:hypothetical protein
MAGPVFRRWGALLAIATEKCTRLLQLQGESILAHCNCKAKVYYPIAIARESVLAQSIAIARQKYTTVLQLQEESVLGCCNYKGKIY